MVVVGVGNTLRGDDGAGPAVAGLVRAQAPPGVSVAVCEQEPTRLLDAFGDADVAVVVDAVSTGAPAGTVHLFDASDEPLPSHVDRSSTHAFGLGEALELARALGRLPPRAVVVGIEGREFAAGDCLTPAVADAVPRAVELVLQEASARAREPG